MSDFQQAVIEGFKEARRVFGVDFTYSATTYRGVMLETAEMLPLMVGGFALDFDGGLEVLKSEIDPTIGGKVTIGSATYRIEHKSGSADDPVQKLYLKGVSK